MLTFLLGWAIGSVVNVIVGFSVFLYFCEKDTVELESKDDDTYG